MKNRSLTALTVLCAVFSISVHADLTNTLKTITVDGSLGDWDNPADVLYDDSEIGEGSPSNVVYETVYVANDSANLYIGIDTKGSEGGAFSNAWTHTVFMDTDMNPATGYDAGWMANGYDRMIQYGVGGTTYSVYEFTGGIAQGSWTWSPALGQITHAYNDDTLEFSLPLSWLGISSNSLVMQLSVTGAGVTPAEGVWAAEIESLAETCIIAAGEEPHIKTITLDGSLADWVIGDLFYSDAQIGDGAPANSSYEGVYMVNDAFNLYLGLDTKGTGGASITNAWVHNIYLDTDMNPATGFNSGWMVNGYDHVIQYGAGGSFTVNGFTGASQGVWEFTNYLGNIEFGYDDDVAELSIPLSLLNLVSNACVVELSVSGGGIPWQDETWAAEFENTAKTYTVIEPQLETITLDGSLDDWHTPGDVFYNDAQIGDGAPANSSYEAVYLVNDATNLFVGLDMKGAGGASITNTWKHSIYLDTDADSGTGYSPDWMVNGYDCLVEYGSDINGDGLYTLYKFTGSAQSNFTWSTLGSIEYAYSDDVAELAIPLLLLNVSGNLCVVELNVGGAGVTTDTWASEFETAAKTFYVVPHDGPKAIGPLSFTILPGAADMTLSWNAKSGQAYDVEYRTDLAVPPPWLIYTSLVAAADGDLTLTGAVDHVEVYYQVVTPEP